MPDKPMRDDELSRRLFSDEHDDATAGLARQALTRLDDQGPVWLDEVATAPPAAPAALVEAALARDTAAARPPRPRRLWLWGGSLAAAALAGLLVLRSDPPPVGVEPANAPSPPAAAQPAAPITVPAPPAKPKPVPTTKPAAPAAPAPPPRSGGLLNAGQMAVMPAKPVLSMVKTIPRVNETLAAYVAAPGEATLQDLLQALEEGGLRLDSSPDITAIQVDPALLQGPLPARLKVLLDGKGGLSIAE